MLFFFFWGKGYLSIFFVVIFLTLYIYIYIFIYAWLVLKFKKLQCGVRLLMRTPEKSYKKFDCFKTSIKRPFLDNYI